MSVQNTAEQGWLLRAGIWALALVLGSWVCPSVVRAGLSVTPGMIEITASRGDTYSNVCEVTNRGDAPVTVHAVAEDWRKGFRGQPVSGWLSMEPESLPLEPGQTGAFTYSIEVGTEDAGEHNAQIFFTEKGDGDTQVHTRIGVVVYVAVRETMDLLAEIADVQVHVARDGNRTAASAKVGVHNMGNVHVRPTGDVKIYDEAGEFVLAVILRTGWGILPGETYAYHGSDKGPAMQPGTYKAVAEIQYGKLYKKDAPYGKTLFFEVDDQGNSIPTP